MIAQDIISTRLYNESLVTPLFKNSPDLISYLGAVQAQDYSAAKWALGLRLGQTDSQIEEAFNKGDILRTHVMRPTWHFVHPKDIRWMLKLTAPRIKQFMNTYNKKLELDVDMFHKCNKIIEKTFDKEKYLTRTQLALALDQAGVAARGQRLGHIVANAELDAVICSGPRLGKQFSYALLESRAPKVEEISREESLSKLAFSYFTSHGPAQIKDFSWWSGLTIKNSLEAIDSIKSKLETDEIDGKTYYFKEDLNTKKLNSPFAFLLSIYDEYVIAYKDRSTLGGERFIEKLLSMGNFLTAALIIDGEIVGTWKRVLKKDSVEVKVDFLRKLDAGEKEAVKKAAETYGKFLNLDVRIIP